MSPTALKKSQELTIEWFQRATRTHEHTGPVCARDTGTATSTRPNTHTRFRAILLRSSASRCGTTPNTSITSTFSNSQFISCPDKTRSNKNVRETNTIQKRKTYPNLFENTRQHRRIFRGCSSVFFGGVTSDSESLENPFGWKERTWFRRIGSAGTTRGRCRGTSPFPAVLRLAG